MLDVLFKGGPTMVPLMVCSILSLAVFIERFLYFRKLDNNNFRLFKKLELLIANSNLSKAKKMVKAARGPVAAMVEQGLEGYGEDKATVREYVKLGGENEIRKMEKRLRILDFIATIAPLLGLLGTVIGIINSFNILAGAQGMAGPGALSVGIAQALISTAAGLIVAIPTTLFYTYLDSQVEDKTNELNQWSAKLVNLLAEDGSTSRVRGDRYVSKR
ncbi:MotA/TolQ/ExbB proton channel family protein [Fuchsiella alkaliacetigena]|uniref:MotA/TolQ/ExbB proton channel family protein n=1 Tax=Fuchsiella alkaliacetigena TaxID=957042 RepID=UPI00200B7D2D|nr:MotA/TolQ/ExbB proton channel family protein [Fuchsiella alkaliacetigena]MCK8824250.1 MotA/TolQ/ExbB proton channel family protein [Fuchsiella alkaliacetigena]